MAEKSKVTVAAVEGEVDYDALMKEFGVEPIEEFLKKFDKKNLPPMYRRGVVFAHRNFGRIYESIINKKKFAVLTGFNPSGPPHLGNLLFLKQALFFQEMGADVFIPISNDETYVFKKQASLEKATQIAYEQVIPDIIALGFKKKKTHIFVSTEERRVYELAVKLSAKTTFSTIKAIFGFDNETNPGAIFYTIVQAAHILLPQLQDFGGPKPTVVPIGIDQDPYMRLSRDLAEKAGFVKPSSTYHKFMLGLQGGKMSGSKPETCIYLNEKPDSVRRKVWRAFSGGGATLQEHKEKGGNPDIDVACQYLYFLFEESDKKVSEIFSGYRNGSVFTGEVKELLIKRITDFLKEHQKAREKAKKHVDDYMLK
ncbi:MAG: tryptophan--tRNA ligase [Candidatus Aenigmarchaeota archaeon]|nr:tryptophan--tRNA ligase [Candidatus Aenigmarchaeota archaeon]